MNFDMVESNQEVTTPAVEVPDFKPTIDKSKSMTEQAEDVVVVMGADVASRDKRFINKVADSFAKGVINEQEANRIKKENLLAEQFFIKWRDVLKLAHITETQGLGLMRTVVLFMMLPYFFMRFIGFIFMVVSETFEFFNTLFNAVFGEVKHVQLDENGRKIAQKTGYNIFAKLLLGFVIIVTMLAMLLLTIKVFTGFDTFVWLRSLMSNG